MKRILILSLAFAALCVPLAATKYAGEIFRMGAGVRNYALGGCGVADPETFAAAYWNPALLSRNASMRFELLHDSEYDGLMNYDVASGTFGKQTPISFTLARIGIDDVPMTRLPAPTQPPSNDNRPYVYKTVNNADYVLWAGTARQVGPVVLGIAPKLAWRTMADDTAFGFGADLGTLFEPVPGWLVGLRLRDFFTTQIFWSGDGSHETVNPGLDVESNLPFTIPVVKASARLFTGIETYSEGRDESATSHIGPVSMDYHVGLAIRAHRNVDLLAGWDVEHPTAGLSLNLSDWRINYAYEHNSELDDSHRVSIGYVFE